MIPYFQIPPLELFGVTASAFGVLVACGFLLGSHLMIRRAIKMGLDPARMYDIALLCLVCGGVGSHVFYVVAYAPSQLIENPWVLLRVWDGISSFGGFVSAALGIWIYLRRKKLPFFPYADAILFGLVPGWILGRLGCFTAHDHIGRITTFPLAVRFPSGTRHDLGLYEAVITIVLAIALYGLLGKRERAERVPDGLAMTSVMIVYGLIRFYLDTLRATDIPGADARYFDLTPAQYLCVFSVGFGIYLQRRIWRAGFRTSQPRNPAP